MAIQTLETIKNWFRTSLKPTQQQFWDTWDSFRHKDEKITVEEILDLNEIISSKTEKSDFKTINGESLIGSGDIATSLQNTLDNNRIWYKYDGSILKSMFSVGADTGFGNNSFSWFNERSSLYISGQESSPIGFALSSGKNINESEPTTPAITLQADLPLENGTLKFKLPNSKTVGEYTIATTDDVIGLPVSATESGIINNDSLQELGGTDKLINGIRIGKGNTNYENNLVIGRNGLASITTGKYNVAIGNGDGEIEGPLQYLTTGSNNTMVGSDAGVKNTTGNYNTGIGTATLFNNTTGNYNTAVGAYALTSNTEGNSNTALGVLTLNSNTTGTNNEAFGRSALSKNTTGSYNTALGSSTLLNNTTGLYNTAIGGGTLFKNQFGSQNVAIGFNALKENVGTEGSNIFGHRSIAIGANAMTLNTTGHGLAIGNFAMCNQTTGTHNIAVGFQSGSGITTGNGNVIFAGTGFIQAGGGITTGNNNMILAPNNGNTTGITTGNGNVILGKVSGLNAALENNIIISNGVGNIKAQNDGTNWKFTGQLNKTALDTAPASATAIGTVGEIRYTADYIYVCTASNKWVRSALTTW